MQAKDLRAAVYRIVGAYNEGNLDVLDDLYSANLFCHRPPYPDIHDLKGYKQMWTGFLSAFPDCQVIIDRVIVEGDTAAVWLTYSGTHTGRSGSGMPPTGKQVSGPNCFRYDFVDGKVVEEWVYGDELGFWQQLGYELVLPQEGAGE
jgi:predicted ester cyclase